MFVTEEECFKKNGGTVMRGKKRLLAGLLVMLLVFTGVPMYGVEAKADEAGDYVYSINSDGDSVTITDYKGSGGNIVIPSEIGWRRVTDIGRSAFSGCSELTGVVIPDGVNSIGASAFSRCNSLQSVSIPDNVKQIGEYAFFDCSSLVSVDIPNQVTSLKAGVFQGCSSLQSVTISDNVTWINEYAFADCGKLTNVVIPKRVLEIRNYAFSGCSSLNSVTIPDYATIYEGAFSGCSSLQSVMLPKGHANIWGNAFSGCTSLTSVTIPKNIQHVAGNAFSGCTELERIKVEAGNERYDSRENCNAVIETQTNALILGCKDTVIPDGVTSIEKEAFFDCRSLISIVIPESVTTIRSSAFSGCSSLADVTIPDGVTSIGGSVFSDCSSLVSAVIPESVAGIGEYAFSSCSSLADITIPEKITSIEKGVFSDCSSLTSIRIPDSVTSIGAYAFSGCSGLESITIPNGITSMGYGAFWGCSGLTDIRIPDGLTKIEACVFNECSGLKNVIISKNVTEIEKNAFKDCGSLESIKVDAENTMYDSREDCNAIVMQPGNLVLGCKNTTIPESVTSIEKYAFRNCSGLTSMLIPENVTSIGEFAFEDCSNLESVIISDGVTSIEMGAFSNCSGLKSIIIPGSVKSIESSAFLGCGSLNNVIIENGVESIGYCAFEDCGSLKSVSIPESITNIGGKAFGYVKSDDDYQKMPDFVICGNTSKGKGYALANGFTFEEISANDIRWALIILEKNEYVYDGQQKMPSVTVELAGETLAPDIDYTVAYDNNIKVGTAIVTVTGQGDYEGSMERIFTIQGDLSNAEVRLEKEDYIYNGQDRKPSVTVRLDGEELVPDMDYIVAYSNYISAGTAVAKVMGKGKYRGSIEKEYTISQAELSEADIVLKKDSYQYDGQVRTPSVTVKLDGMPLGIHTDYTVAYSDNVNAGTATVTVTGIGSCQGNVKKTFAINPVDISQADVSLEKDSYQYDGQAKTPSVTVELNGKTLSVGADYTIAYSDNINAGTAKVTVEGKGNYAGSIERKFFVKPIDNSIGGTTDNSTGGTIDNSVGAGIGKMDVAKATVSLERTSYTYDGQAKTPSVTVRFGAETLIVNRDYRVTYSNNVNVGTAMVVVTGMGSYYGSVEKNFTINAAEQGLTCPKKTYNVVYGVRPFKIKASSNSKLSYKTSDDKVADVDKNTGKVTVKGTGTAYITVKAGLSWVRVTVRVSPKKQTVKAIKADKGGKMTVKWAKDKMATGYQVQLSTSRNFKKIAKSKNVKKISKNSYTFTRLKAGKKYYIRVRSYKVSRKTTLYGAWSLLKQSGKIHR